MTTISEAEYYQISEEISAKIDKIRGPMLQRGDLTVKMLRKQKGLTRYEAQDVLDAFVASGEYEVLERPGNKGYIYRPIADNHKV